MTELDDSDGLRRRYAEFSDEALLKAHALGETGYQPAAWRAIVAEVASRGLASTAAERAEDKWVPPPYPRRAYDLEALWVFGCIFAVLFVIKAMWLNWRGPGLLNFALSVAFLVAVRAAVRLLRHPKYPKDADAGK